MADEPNNEGPQNVDLNELMKKVQELEAANAKVVADYQALQHEFEEKERIRVTKEQLKQQYPDVDIDELTGTVEEIATKAKALQEKIDAKVKIKEEQLKKQFADQWGVPLESAGVSGAGQPRDLDKEIEEAKAKKDPRNLISAIFGKHKEKVDKWLKE